MSIYPIITLAALLLFSADPVSAQTSGLTLDGIERAFSNVLRTLVIVAGFLAVIYILLAGIRWTTAGGDQTKVQKAKDMLKSGLIGAAIVFGVGTIVATIQAFF